MIGATSNQSQDQHNNRTLNNPQQGQQATQHQQHAHQHLVNHRTRSANQKHSADDDYEEDHGMRVGSNYQAEIPQFIAYAPAPEYYEDERAIRVWSPYNKIPDHVLEEYLTKAKDRFYYNTEQALGMLCWHKFDLNRAYADLPNFVPYPNEWSVEDKVMFEQAYQFHEKQFGRIRQMLPDKTMANLINYYYTWKKTRTRASLMERQTRRLAARKAAYDNGQSGEDENEDDNENENENDNEIRNEAKKDNTIERDDTNGTNSEERTCNCDEDTEPHLACSDCSKELRDHGKNVEIIIESGNESFCKNCYVKYKTNKRSRQEPELGDCFYHPEGEPKRILFSYNDVVNLVSSPPSGGELTLRQLDTQIQDAKREIQAKKQHLSQINEKIQPITNQIADLNMNEFSDILPEYKPTKNWTPEETQMVIQGLRRYGADFNAISDIVRTKSPAAVQLFYVQQKDRLGLEVLVNRFEESREISAMPRPQVDPDTTAAQAASAISSRQVET